MSLKIVFLGTKNIGASCLEYMLETAVALNFEVIGIATKSEKQGDKIREIATKSGIPVLCSLDELPECDIIYSVQYHRILKQKEINKARKIALNLHMAPLPEFRGCNQFSFAILEDRKTFGVTIHQMDARIDHGDILFEKRFPIPEDCWVNELFDLAVQKSEQLFQETLAKIISGDYSLTPQCQIKQGTESQLHFREEIKNLKEIPPDLPEEELKRRIRATMMPGFEPPYRLIAGEKKYFSKADVIGKEK